MADPKTQRFQRGEKAYRTGIKQSANPYNCLSESWDEWNAGWVYAEKRHVAQVLQVRAAQQRRNMNSLPYGLARP